LPSHGRIFGEASAEIRGRKRWGKFCYLSEVRAALLVLLKREGQHNIQALRRIRKQLLKSRTALVNQVRGLLAEHGIVEIGLPQ
jgi:transposase